jgi:hypothetical protein
MKLNRERIVAGLSLLILIFGIYEIARAPRAEDFRPIATEVPPSTQETPRVEPRLYFDQTAGDRNPFQLASDWLPLTPESLPPPPPEITGWFLLPLGKGPDPADVGFVYPRETPVEVKSDDEESKPGAAGAEGPAASPSTAPSGAKGESAEPSGKEKPPAESGKTGAAGSKPGGAGAAAPRPAPGSEGQKGQTPSRSPRRQP